jgi:hypothetical protein
VQIPEIRLAPAGLRPLFLVCFSTLPLFLFFSGAALWFLCLDNRLRNDVCPGLVAFFASLASFA